MEGYTIFDGVVLKRFSVTFVAVIVFLAAQLPESYVLANDLRVTSSASANLSVLPVIQFSIKPRLCVLNAGEKICRDKLAVKWLSPQARSLCLYQTDKIEPLRCWQDATQGEYQFELAASVSTDFQLRELHSNLSVSEQRFQVVYNDKKYRRARRNPWSFF